MIAAWWVWGCRGDDPPPLPTGTPSSSTVGAAAPDGTLFFYGTEPRDEAGREVSVADADGDGLADVLVGAPSGWIYGYETVPASPSAYLLRRPSTSGPLDDVAAATYLGLGLGDYYGDPSAILPADGRVVLWSGFEDDSPARLFDGAANGRVAFTDAEIVLDAPDWEQMDGMTARLADCGSTVLGVGSWCLTSHENGVDEMAFGGTVYVLPPAPDGTVTFGDSALIVRGAAGDGAEVVDGSHDVDGDGFSDLLIGAHASLRGGDPGRVAVVDGAATGIVDLADVTTASLVGEAPDGELGLSVHAGDLDGDGTADVFGGAPLAPTPCVYGNASPWTGEVAGAGATWRFCADRWLGYDFALGDLDGDGALDLAAGAPSGAGGPGLVYVWSAPGAGDHDASDADLRFGSGSPTADFFGYRVGAGDIDGDGRADLAVGAPYHDGLAEDAGMVAIVPGGGL